jgi:transposase
MNPIILHDNVRAHTADAVKDLLCCWRWPILEYPPYSPDMSPCDDDLFAKMKEPLRVTHYNTRRRLFML